MPQFDLNNPATLVDPVTGLPLTPFEIDQLRHQRVTQINEKRELHRLRKANQAKGFDEPKIGQTLHVQLDGSITRRSRAGMRFEKGSRIELTVVSDADYEDAKAKNAAAPVVTVLGAERIIEDDSLHVFEGPMSDSDAAELRQRAEELEGQLESERAANAQLRQQLEAMRARRAAPESVDGKPTKLPAAAAARAGDAQTSAPTGKPAPGPSDDTHNDFGAPAGKK